MDRYNYGLQSPLRCSIPESILFHFHSAQWEQKIFQVLEFFYLQIYLGFFYFPFMPKGLNLSPGNTFLTFNFLGFTFFAQKEAFAGREPIEKSYLFSHPVSLLISKFHLGRFFFHIYLIILNFHIQLLHYIYYLNQIPLFPLFYLIIEQFFLLCQNKLYQY